MPWQEVSSMGLRREFACLALRGGITMAALCRRFCISRKTGYKWLNRFNNGEPLTERSRRPLRFRCKTTPGVEQRVIALRREHAHWGGRKINKLLGGAPAPSTITAILRRNGLLNPAAASSHKPYVRFERAQPNELWQLDFKGDFAMLYGRCYPLTMVDDHSRYGLCLKACLDERYGTVRPALEDCFRRYGLPEAMGMDNGAPWGGGYNREVTRFGVWLMRLGIKIIHGRPRHPQTQGKNERFNRTLGLEAIRGRIFSGLEEAQSVFDDWLSVYNTIRPHKALGLATPVERYSLSRRAYPEQLPDIEYDAGALVRKVHESGVIGLNGKRYKVGKALAGLPVALVTGAVSGQYDVMFCGQRIRMLDLRTED